MRPRSHQRDERHRSRRAALPKYFPLSHSMMTLLNGLIPDQAQHRGSSSFDNMSGQTGTDSRATKRSFESHCDLIPPLITTLSTFLSTPRDLGSAPMLRCLRRRLMTGLTLRPGAGDLDLAPLPLEMEGFHQINRSTTPSSLHSFKSKYQ